MILRKPSFEMLDRLGLNPLQKIELAGRTCYKSEDKITEDSAKGFVQMLIKRGHDSVLEHSNIILRVTLFRYFWLKFMYGKFLNFTLQNWRPIVSGNVRAWRELGNVYFRNRWVNHLLAFLADKVDPVLFCDLVDLKRIHTIFCIDNVDILTEDDLTDPTEQLIHITRTVKIVCNRGISHELVRHRVFSFSQESTRFCDYSGGQITYIIPPWINVAEGIYGEEKIDTLRLDNPEGVWLTAMYDNETIYQLLRDMKQKPEQARGVLATDLKTEIVLSATLFWWNYFFQLRAEGVQGRPHPQMLEITVPMLEEFTQEFPDLFGQIKGMEMHV